MNTTPLTVLNHDQHQRIHPHNRLLAVFEPQQARPDWYEMHQGDKHAMHHPDVPTDHHVLTWDQLQAAIDFMRDQDQAPLTIICPHGICRGPALALIKLSLNMPLAQAHEALNAIKTTSWPHEHTLELAAMHARIPGIPKLGRPKHIATQLKALHAQRRDAAKKAA